MAAVSPVPVVNALTDQFHPCQILADLQTIREHKGRLAGLTFAYLGDAANNMAHSYLLGGATRGHARPRRRPGRLPARRRGSWPTPSASPRGTGGSVTVTDDPAAAARRRRRRRHRHLGLDGAGGRAGRARGAVPALRASTAAALAQAAADAIVLHCLPAYRGKEIAAEVIDGAAERRLGRGREPAARAEGAADVPAGARADERDRARSTAERRQGRAARPHRRGPGRAAGPLAGRARRAASTRPACTSPRPPCRATSTSSARSSCARPTAGLPVYVVPEDGSPLTARAADDAPPQRLARLLGELLISAEASAQPGRPAHPARRGAVPRVGARPGRPARDSRARSPGMTPSWSSPATRPADERSPSTC